jgi:hypothetical protein
MYVQYEVPLVALVIPVAGHVAFARLIPALSNLIRIEMLSSKMPRRSGVETTQQA